jgi:polar amino acid transport system substrate-binding protein
MADESRLDTVLKRGVLIVGTYSTGAPMSFTDENGNFVGFEVDLAKQIAADLLGDAKKIQFVTFDSSGRFPAVLSGKVDFGIAATTVYPERAVRMAFTTPYMDSGISVVVREDSHINSLADLDDPKYTLAIMTNPEDSERAARFFPKAKTVTFDSSDDDIVAVKTGRATAAPADTPIANWYAVKDKTLKVLPGLLGAVQNNAIFLQPGDFKWWLFLDTEVRELLTGSRYGVYTDLYKKWFGMNPPPQRFYTAGSQPK